MTNQLKIRALSVALVTAFCTLAFLPRLANATELEIPSGSLLVSQFDADDSYDPFADYSEFEDASDEEADVNFFRNGRFFTLGLAFGYRRFTNVMGEIYKPGTNFGGFLSYFFDLRFALQVGYMVGDHEVELQAPTRTFRGNITLSSTSFYLKYFLNTQNVTRGLAKLNPYLIGGFSQNYRTYKISGTEAYGRDSAIGFDGGIGCEIPMMRNKMFFGLQLLYQIVNFSDENSEIIFQDSASGANVPTSVYPRGDVFSGNAILGINF
jgi:hypothetical protein